MPWVQVLCQLFITLSLFLSQNVMSETTSCLGHRQHISKILRTHVNIPQLLPHWSTSETYTSQFVEQLSLRHLEHEHEHAQPQLEWVISRCLQNKVNEQSPIFCPLEVNMNEWSTWFVCSQMPPCILSTMSALHFRWIRPM